MPKRSSVKVWQVVVQSSTGPEVSVKSSKVQEWTKKCREQSIELWKKCSEDWLLIAKKWRKSYCYCKVWVLVSNSLPVNVPLTASVMQQPVAAPIPMVNMELTIDMARDLRRYNGEGGAIISRKWLADWEFLNRAEKMIELIMEELAALMEANLTCRLEKCVFVSKEVEYLGFVVSGGKLKPGPGKARTIRDFSGANNISWSASMARIDGKFYEVVAAIPMARWMVSAETICVAERIVCSPWYECETRTGKVEGMYLFIWKDETYRCRSRKCVHFISVMCEFLVSKKKMMNIKKTKFTTKTELYSNL